MLALLLIMVAAMAPPRASAQPSTFYVLAGAAGANTGADWANAFSQLPTTLQRGATYYIGDGTYPTYIFDDAPYGSALIVVKKATPADHGTEQGWADSMGDGQAVFQDALTFASSYVVFDGNGTHSVPSSNSSDYGFRVAANSAVLTTGIIRIGAGTVPVTDVTIRYTHVYNTSNSTINNGTVSVRLAPTASQRRIKLQYCYLQNSGKDGIQISISRFVLVEKCYLERLGMRMPGVPDYHGQAVQMFWNVEDVIFRWNIWRSNEGQSLIAYGDNGTTTRRIRFYGNVVFTPHNTIEGAGFNSSGGLIGNAWPDATEVSHLIVYNNTFVNQRDSQSTTGATALHFPLRAITVSSNYLYNNLFFNSNESISTRFTANSHHASGLGGSSGGVNEQSNITESTFIGYKAGVYRLAMPTEPGKDLTAEPWWNDAPDPFFGTVDSLLDIDGRRRGEDGSWDRGAYEYGPPQPPFNLRVLSSQ